MNGKCCEKCGAPMPDAGGAGDEAGMAELLGGGEGGEGGDAETLMLEKLLSQLGGQSVERFKKPEDEFGG